MMIVMPLCRATAIVTKSRGMPLSIVVTSNMITKEQALTENMFHDEKCNNWRRNGRTQTWKREPNAFRVPVKFGLYDYGQISNHSSWEVHVPSDTCVKNRP